MLYLQWGTPTCLYLTILKLITMKQLLCLGDFEELCKSRRVKKTLAVVCPNDEATLGALSRAASGGIVRPLLFVCKPLGDAVLSAFGEVGAEIEMCADQDACCHEAVRAVREGRAEAIMKGSVNTDDLLHAILNKEHGILAPGSVLTHLALLEAEGHPKLLLFSDAAVIPWPSTEQFDSIVRYCVSATAARGIMEPKVALINFTEKLNKKFPQVESYIEIKRRALAGDYDLGSVRPIVEGPMDVATAIDRRCALIKGIASPVAGDADVLVFPNIEAGNTFYKTVATFARSTCAGWLAGAAAPVIVSSRADSEDNKYFSIATVCALC